MTDTPRSPRQPVPYRDEESRRMFIMEGKIVNHAVLYMCSDFYTRGAGISYLACPFCGQEIHAPHGQLRQCTNGHSMVAMGNGLYAWPDATAPKEQILDDATDQERREQRISAMAQRGQCVALADFLLKNPQTPPETGEPPHEETPEPPRRKTGFLDRLLGRTDQPPPTERP